MLFVSKTSSRRLQDMPSTRLQDRSLRRLQDMSSRPLQDMSSRLLHDVFNVTIFCLPRRLARCLQDAFKTYLHDVFKTSWNTKNCYAEDVLKTSSRHVLKTSWRRLEDVLKTNKCFLGSTLFVHISSAKQCAEIFLKWRGDNYLTKHLVKFLQDRIKPWRVRAFKMCTGYHFL